MWNEKDLKELVVADHLSAITYFEFLLAHNDFPSFEAFRLTHSSRSELKQCQRTWHNRMAIACRDCGTADNACICIECFNNGDHKGHNVVIRPSSSGNCDCGSPSFWNPRGFCRDHAGLDSSSKLEYPAFRDQFEKIIGLIFRVITESDESFKGCVPLLHWVQNWVRVSDVFRRMVGVAIIEKCDFGELLIRIVNMDKQSCALLGELIGNMVSDPYFSHRFCEGILNTGGRLQNEIMKRKAQSKNYGPLVTVLFHAFARDPIIWVLDKGFDFGKYQSKFFADVIRRVCSDIGAKQSISWEISHPDLDTLFCVYETVYDARPAEMTAAAQMTIDTAVQTFCDCGQGFVVDLSKLDREINGVYRLHTTMKVFKSLPKSIDIDPSKMFKASVRLWKDIAAKPPGGWEAVDLASCSDHLVGTVLMRKRDKLKETVERLCKANGISIDTFCVGSAARTMHLNALMMCFDRAGFPDRDELAHLITQMLHNAAHLHTRHSQEFMQMTMGLVANKDLYVRTFWNIIVSCKVVEGDGDVKTRRFAFLYRILSHVVDRTLHDRAHSNTWKELVVLCLHLGRSTITEVEKVVSTTTIWKAKKLQGILDEVASSTEVKGEKVYTLRSESLWNPISPYAGRSYILRELMKWVSTHHGQMLPFHEWMDEYYGMELGSTLNTPTIRAFVYWIISDFVHKSEGACEVSLHLALGTLLYASRGVVSTKIPVSGKTINAGNVDALIDAIPGTMSFMNFMNQNISFSGREATSVLEMTKSLGALGVEFASKIGILIAATEDVADVAQEKRNAAKRARENVLRAQKARARLFATGDVAQNVAPEEKESEVELCVSCSRSSTESSLGYPVTLYNTTIPHQFDGKAEWNSVVAYRLCVHKVHSGCVPVNTNFPCPMCRRRRNAVMPILPNDGPLTDGDRRSLDLFLRSFMGHAKGGHRYNSLIASLSDVIVIFDVRLRLFPDSLDAVKYGLIARNLFAVIRHLVRINPDLNEHGLEEVTLFRGFMAELCESGDLSAVDTMIKTRFAAMHGDSVSAFKFARLAVLTKYFCLGLPVSSGPVGGLVDWDAVLSPDSLAESYGVKLDIGSYVLPCFSLIPLPELYTDLAKEEWNKVPIWKCKPALLLSLTDGKVLVFRPNSGADSKFQDLNEYRRLCKDDIIVVMALGREATAMLSGDRDVLSMVQSIYVDARRETDLGFSRGGMAYLWRERYERLADNVLSGECAECAVVE